MTSKLSCAALLPTSDHTATVWMVHGYNEPAGGQAWADLFQIVAAEMPHVKFIFPHAPVRPITFRGGEMATAWFDILAWGGESTGPFPGARLEDTDGMFETVSNLVSWIRAESESSGVPTSRTCLGGFSQGCAMSMLTTITSTPWDEGGVGKLAGVYGMGGFVPLKDRAKELCPPNNPNLSTPLALFHGTADVAVTPARALVSRDCLISLRFSPSWKEYEGLDHSANLEEIKDVGEFLKKCLPEVEE